MKKSKISMAELAAITIKDAVERVASGENSDRLVVDYRQRWNAYCKPYFGNMKVADVDAPVLRNFKASLTDRGLKGTSVAVVMCFVSVMLKLAMEDGHIDRLPNIPRPKHQDSPRPWFTKDDYKSLLKFLMRVEKGRPVIEVKGRPIDCELRWMVTFMVNSFLRPGDLFKLRHRHVDIIDHGDGTPRYLRLNLPPSKNHSYPIITMPAAVHIYERIVRRQERAGPIGRDDFVFVPEWPNRRYALELTRRQFTAVLKAANLKEDALGEEHTLYSLRHTAIMFRLLNADGLDLLTLARACRTSVEMIDRFYAKSLTAEMNRDRLHSFRHPTRYAAA